MRSDQPIIEFHTLQGADGSATYTSPNSTHTLVSGVNYPVEVPYRSDEDPESTYIEVSVRPHNGVSMVRERYIEDVVRTTLGTIVLGEETPRTMLQVTIQVQGMESDESLPGGVKEGGQGDVNGVLDLITGSVNVSVLGCLDAGVRMRSFAGAVLVGIEGHGRHAVLSPNVNVRKECVSLHVFGFDARGECVLMESQGEFDVADWETAESVARRYVCGTAEEHHSRKTNGDIDMSESESAFSLLDVIRKSFEAKVARDERWRA